MTKTRVNVQVKITTEFDEVCRHASIGYVHDASYNLSDKPEVARKLGEAFFDYMVASIYDTDWEGYSTLELKGIAAMMKDFRTAIEHGLLK